MPAFAPLGGSVDAAYHVVSALAAGVGAAAAIVVFTIAVRVLLFPLSYAQARNSRRLAALAPRVEELRRRHRKDPARLGSELSTLYRTAGASPYRGCLPALLQAPFFLVLYRLFTMTHVAGGPNHLLAESLYGVPLNAHLSGALAHGLFSGPVAVFAILLAALAGLAWLASRRMRAAAATSGGAPGGGPAGLGGGKSAERLREQNGPATARLARLIPYGTLLAAAVLPLAAVVYLLTTNAWTAMEATIFSLGR